MVVHALLQQCRTVLQQCLISQDCQPAVENCEENGQCGWNTLTQSASQRRGQASELPQIEAVGTRATSLFREYCDLYGDSPGTDEPEVYLTEIMCESIKLATISNLIMDVINEETLNQLFQLHADEAIIFHPLVQATATDSLIIFARNYPSAVTRISDNLRQYIASPLPPPDVTVNDNDLEPSYSLVAAAHGLTVCVELIDSPDFTKTTTHALLNLINTSDAEINNTSGSTLGINEIDRRASYIAAQTTHQATSPESAQLISINCLQALVILLKELDQVNLTSELMAMLLLRIKGATPSLEAVILAGIAELAIHAHLQSFKDAISTFSSINKNIPLQPPEVSTDSVIRSGIYRAQINLSKTLASRDHLCELYLEELLTLFIEKGQHIQSTHTALPKFSQLVNHLGVLILAIGNLLQTTSTYDPRQTTSSKISELFRNFWYICVLFGFLSSPPASRATSETPSVFPDWLSSSLRKIATKSPTLTHRTPIDYLTTQLDYNPILKFPDAVEQGKKQELANLIPSHSGQIKGFTFIQTIFLLTVARLEIFRAEDCRASNVLEYLRHVHPDEIDANNLFGCLVTISEKVLSTFISSFQQRVIRHSEVPHVHREIPEILKFTCHHSSKIRAIALRYCQDLIIAFPTLLCKFETVRDMLELLSLLRQACEGEYSDEYTPVYTFHSESANLTIELTDDYTVRQETLSDLNKSIGHWLSMAIARAPLEMQSIFQRYLDGVSSQHVIRSIGQVEMGKSVALELAKTLPPTSALSHLPSWGNWKADLANDVARSFSNRMFYNGEATHLASLPEEELKASRVALQDQLNDINQQVTAGQKKMSIEDLSKVLYKAGSHVLANPKPDLDFLAHIVNIPIRVFTPLSVALGLELWTWLIDVKPEVEIKLMTDVINMWAWTLRRRKGLFSSALNLTNPLNQPIQLIATDRDEMHHQHNTAKRTLKPHHILLDFLSSRFQAARYQNRNLVLATMRLLKKSFANVEKWSTHPLSRELRARLLIFGFSICQGSRMEETIEHLLREVCYRAAFNWFNFTPSFSFASNRIQHESELRLLQDLLAMVTVDVPVNSYHLTSLDPGTRIHRLPGRSNAAAATLRHSDRNQLLQLLLENEIVRLTAWQNPLSDTKRGRSIEPTLAKATGEIRWRQMVQTAWSIDPQLMLRLVERFKFPYIEAEVGALVKKFPNQARNVPEALNYFVGQGFDMSIVPNIHHILYWKKTPVVTALSYFLPQYDNDPILLQYAMRVLEEHPVEVTFFYIPQVVQALRTDSLGYVERFICETARVSQLFCHQIIWNMKANTFRGDDAVEPDPLKPTLDRIIQNIVDSLSGDAKQFYETEFKFFDEVTGISKTLRDYLKKDKAEKKAKIAEELAKIKLAEGVYLPSNPDGVVIDIDRSSGRPLQSHAKTPFMATFKVHRQKTIHTEDQSDQTGEGIDLKLEVDTWQAAIFKVGDDCRQDVLALQLIAIHKTIYETMCLDLHLVPYRVTATAPGCGVIDVIPDATSRDEMGRAKINDLQSFFIGKFGPVESEAYQRARMNFIRSMAAYSVMCYLIQIKDRHNGNIMIDGEGHITHIDFGFLFDIGPGGIKFEPNSFKLTGEMIVMMGGQHSAGFKAFQELVVKAFLIARPFAKEIVMCVKLMSETQLPSFKGESTMVKLMERFKPHLSEREATVYIQGVIANAKQNGLSLLYDEFQWMTNEIPYTQRDWIARAH
ncbi:hypothetical protein CROQUDRAFT_46568 [Cronartium quercuum f. sp. fusiforme G11]|uniref:1-phosphatidylinositol 4-kinase n=1 Tax=Cronartium quercuum f. sp. fusiforme G11 TaxID=708437 RepID=A0A9P6NDT8_9BASI|nr:hypothetical protein CROQUDRAFT_46568 [Cronartium quercuum f. sp. fusiforme G11]